VSNPWFGQVVNPIEALLEKWRQRGDTDSVNALLPPWRGNFGLIDGWADVLGALRLLEERGQLPPDEMATIANVAGRVERAINGPDDDYDWREHVNDREKVRVPPTPGVVFEYKCTQT
jgi:hypothetical protein